MKRKGYKKNKEHDIYRWVHACAYTVSITR